MWGWTLLIFDELAEAKKILSDKDLEYFNLNKMTILAKYFSYIGKSKKEIRESMIDFCNSQHYIKYDSGDDATITKAINSLKKYKIRLPKMCFVTQNELDEIGTINNPKTERIFFVMICLAKYAKETNTAKVQKEYPEEKLIYWGTTAELFKLARYSENFFNRNIIIGDIEDLNYIETKPNKDRTKNHIEINTYYKDSSPVIFFDNPEYVYKLYKAYKDEKLIQCVVCGNSTVKNSNRQTMCEKCWNEKESVDCVIRKRRQREAEKCHSLENATNPCDITVV